MKSLRSKIARLPPALREALNERLHVNDMSGAEVVSWLNETAKLEGASRINEQNLSDWRHGSFLEWEADQKKCESIRRLADLALRVAEASGGENLTEAAVRIAAGKLLPMLEMADEEQLPDLVAALDKLAGKELAARKDVREAATLALAKEKEAREAERLALDKQKFARDSAQLFLRWRDDERAKEIADGNANQETKVGQLIQLWFGDMPDGIGPAHVTTK